MNLTINDLSDSKVLEALELVQVVGGLCSLIMAMPIDVNDYVLNGEHDGSGAVST